MDSDKMVCVLRECAETIRDEKLSGQSAIDAIRSAVQRHYAPGGECDTGEGFNVAIVLLNTNQSTAAIVEQIEQEITAVKGWNDVAASL
jgi:hypothetical protein